MAVGDTLDLNAERLVMDMSERIAILDPNSAPFTVLLKRMLKKKETGNPKFYCLEAAPKTVLSSVLGAQTDEETSIEVAVGEGSLFHVGDIVQNTSTGEVMYVSAVSTDTLTVSRGYGETSAAAMADGDELMILGNAMAEGSSAPAAQNAGTTDIYNYTQIFRTVFHITKTREASKLYGGPDRDFQRKIKGIDHLREINRALMFGERAIDTTSGTEPRRLTRGLWNFIESNVADAGGTLTESEFNQFLEKAFQHGSSEKYALCSPRVLGVINGFAQNKLQTKSGDSAYGLNIKEYLSPFGVLNLVLDRAMTGDKYGYAMIVVDMDNVSYRYLPGRDTQLEIDIQDKGEDAVKDGYLTECGLECKLEETHAILYNVTG